MNTLVTGASGFIGGVLASRLTKIADSIEALTRPIDVLTGGAVVPGFKCRLSRIFRAS